MAFFGRYWRDARAVADAPKRFYAAFRVERGGVLEMVGPGVWVAGFRAMVKGNTGGRVVGDPWTMPALFLVKEDTILWRHEFRHAGDHPDFARIPDLLHAAEG